LILAVDGDQVKSRLISTRETARLMGLEDTYILPIKYNEAYHLTGDGVVVPVVRHLSKYIFEPFLMSNRQAQAAA
jgi:DNA (cytosine-5)-methyltransferase 1